MGCMIVAAAVAVAAAFATGGRLSAVARRPVRGGTLVAFAVTLQLAGSIAGGAARWVTLTLVASYALLIAFALVNLRLAGMSVALVGLLLNTAVIAANGAMPVRAEAVRAIGHTTSPIELDPKHQLATGDDRLALLGDVIPVKPLREVVSFGDLILAAGIANVVFRLLRPAGRRSARRAGRSRPPTSPNAFTAPRARGIDTNAPGRGRGVSRPVVGF